MDWGCRHRHNPNLAEAAGLDDTRGFMVISVATDGPAQKAGFCVVGCKKDIATYSIGGDIVLASAVQDDILVHLQRSSA